MKSTRKHPHFSVAQTFLSVRTDRNVCATGIEAFSLLEVILALGLGVVLVSAIGVAVDQSWRLTTQGHTELTRQQVARAVFRMIERDVRSVTFVPPSEFAEDAQAAGGTNTAAGNSTVNFSANPSGQNSTTNPSANATGGDATAQNSTTTTTGSTGQSGLVLASRGIRGDQSTLEIDGSRPQRMLEFQAAAHGDEAALAFSDLRTIQYLITPPGSAADALARGGLSRREADRYAVLTAAAKGAESAGQFQTALLAAEISAIEFRYFDGTTWHMMWDSLNYGRLPRAIEVQIRFAPPPANRAVWLNQAVNHSSQTARLVISLPAADPLPEGMLP